MLSASKNRRLYAVGYFGVRSKREGGYSVFAHIFFSKIQWGDTLKATKIGYLEKWMEYSR